MEQQLKEAEDRIKLLEAAGLRYIVLIAERFFPIVNCNLALFAFPTCKSNAFLQGFSIVHGL